MPRVGLIITDQAYAITQGKFCFIAWQLQQVGHAVSVLTWIPEVVQRCQEREIPCMVPTVVQHTGLDVIAESKKLYAVLDRPIAKAEWTPTFGQLLAFDDFIGGAQSWRIQGVESWQPEVLVQPNHGSESGHPQDEQVELTLWRWSQRNHIPTIGVEVECAAGPYELTDYPPTRFLRQAQLPPAHRHYCRPAQDPQLEEFLSQEQSLRKKFNLPEGTSAIIVPFSIYHMHEFIKTMQALGEWKKQMRWDGEVLIPVGPDHRRGWTEKDLVVQGCRRWWAALEKVHVIEGVPLLTLALLADGVLLPQPKIHARYILEHYDIPVWYGKGDIQLPRYTTIDRAIREVLQ